MKKISSILAMCLITSVVYAKPKNVYDVVPEKIEIGQGVSNFNSASITKPLPVAKNDMECNSEAAKMFVENSLNGENVSFIGGYKALKKSENVTYCSVTYKSFQEMSKKNFWIVREDGNISIYDFKTMPIACDSEEINNHLKFIADKRKIVIEELGGFELYEDQEDYAVCSFAYKTSDINNVAKLNISISRNEDFNLIFETGENQFED